jgi:hypothetical protein
MKSNAKLSINAKIVLDHVQIVLLPHLAELRSWMNRPSYIASDVM